MIDSYFLILEFLVLILFSLCLRHAWRQGLAVVWQLFAGVVFGLLLEITTTQQLGVYEYARFSFMFMHVPVMVGVAWGTIIYSVRLFSDSSNLPVWARPVLDGLMALNIDLAMDAIAIRLGMWDWGLDFKAQYFGVPYANFWAWFWVVFSFSFGMRLFTWRDGRLGRWLAPMGGIMIGLVGLFGFNALIVDVVSAAWYETTIFLNLGSALALILWLRPVFFSAPPDPLAFWVPFGFHAYFLGAGLISGVILETPVILFISLMMTGVAIYLHRHSWRKYWSRVVVYARSGGK